jgi:hypothetical protein
MALQNSYGRNKHDGFIHGKLYLVKTVTRIWVFKIFYALVIWLTFCYSVKILR